MHASALTPLRVIVLVAGPKVNPFTWSHKPAQRRIGGWRPSSLNGEAEVCMI